MSNTKSYSFSIINTVDKIKEFFIPTNLKYIPWGLDNLAPYHYINFYDSITEHRAAINFTESNVVQSGWGNLDYWLVKKIVFDYMLFGSYALEVIQTRGGQNTINYIDISKCRLSSDKTKIGYFEDLYELDSRGKLSSTNKIDVKWYPITDDIKKGGIYIYKNSKSRTDYSKPLWNASLTSLDTMLAIQSFHNSNAKTSFAPTVIINMNNGEPDAETKKKIEKSIKDKFIGVEGQKFMLLFNEGKENAATVTKLVNDSLDQKFETLQKFIQNQILIGNGITSSQLIGVKADSQGFSKTEFDESLEIFREWLIKPIQKEISYSLNSLLGTNFSFISEDVTNIIVNDEQSQNLNE
jgi:hypothetical protein